MGTGLHTIQEQYIDLDERGEFLEIYQNLSNPLLGERIDRGGLTIGRGHVAEICLELGSFFAEMAGVVSTGYVIFIDYGDAAKNLYHYSRPNGSLRCFYQQAQVYDPFNCIGEQDMTADVDFTAVQSAAEGAGLQWVGQQSQGEWLQSLRGDDDLAAVSSPSNSWSHLDTEQLISPSRLGSAFDVVAFKTSGIPHPPGFDFP